MSCDADVIHLYCIVSLSRRFMTELNLQWDSDYSDDFTHALGGQVGQVGARQRGQLDFHTKREMDMREKKELETAAERTKQRLHLAALEHSPNTLVNGTSVEFGDKVSEPQSTSKASLLFYSSFHVYCCQYTFVHRYWWCSANMIARSNCMHMHLCYSLRGERL